MSWRRAEQEYTDEVIGDDPLPALFEMRAESHRNGVAQMYKGGIYDRSMTPEPISAAPDGSFASLTYGEMRHVVRRLAAGFRELGLDTGDRVGIFSDTRMEWAQTDFALLAAGGTVTTLYENATEEMTEYILDNADAVGVIVEDEDKLDRVLAVADALSLSFVVTIDSVETSADVPVMSLKSVYDRGVERFDLDEYRGWIDALDSEDLASIIYTSGTTGRPKGVKLTHRNFRANVNQIRKRYGPRPDKSASVPGITAETRALSFLPLAHIFERTAGHFTMFAAGACVGYAESPDTLRDDFQLVRPTSATSVPRVYEKLYAAIREQASESPIKERIFHWAVDVGQEMHRTNDPGPWLRLKHRIADRLVFSQVKSALGGEVEMLVSGGGSLSSALCALYHGMGLPIYEGYGLTETAPVVTCNPIEEPKIGTIGPPVVDVEIDIDESVTTESSAEGREGELLVRGPNVSPGYWQLPDETAESFDDEGWFRTGDIVRVRPDDYLEFVERAKEVIVLSTGKNVAPGPIEDDFASSEIVEQCMVIGDSEKFIGALIVPSEQGLDAWAAENDIDLPRDPQARCADQRVRGRIRDEVNRVNESLEDYETIKRFAVVPEEFTEQKDLLTPTMKKKRRNILDRYEQQVAAIYDDVESTEREQIVQL